MVLKDIMVIPTHFVTAIPIHVMKTVIYQQNIHKHVKSPCFVNYFQLSKKGTAKTKDEFNPLMYSVCTDERYLSFHYRIPLISYLL